MCTCNPGIRDRQEGLTFLLFDRWLSCETPHFLLIEGSYSPLPPNLARSSWYRLTRVCLPPDPERRRKNTPRPCVRASLYVVSWYLVTTGEENGSREECRDKFRDRSNGDAVSMLLAFAFRLSIQTPLSPDLLPALPFSPFPFPYLCLSLSSLSPPFPSFSLSISIRFFGSWLRSVFSLPVPRGFGVNYRIKFDR